MNVEDIVRTMSERGLRITEQRKSMVRLFVEDGGYLTPKDVYDRMETSYPGLSFDTVYRNLRLMQELGVLEQFVFEDGVKFRLHCLDGGGHHHHLICLECAKTIPIDYCPMEEVPELPEDFRVVRHKFELFGYCEDCHREQEPPQERER